MSGVRNRYPRRGALRPLAATLILLVAIVTQAGGAAAQERIVVFTEPGTPVVATEILVVAGPANEPEGKAGVAYLAARSVMEPIRPVLDSLGAYLSLAIHKDALSLTMISAPDVWEEATRVLMVALFRDPPAAAVVQRERAAIRAELAARQTNPADAMSREADRAFFGADHPWGRPAVGTMRSVERLTFADVTEFLSSHVTSDRALAVVVGPVDGDHAREHLGGFMVGRGHLRVDAPEPVMAPRPIRVDYNSITTWISASFAFAPEADEEALRLLAHLALRALTTGPDRHLVYNASADVLPRAGAGELRFQLVTPPGSAERLGSQIRETVEQLASMQVPDDVWESRLRRYRGERLQSLRSPDSRANEVARRLLASPASPWLLPDLDGLTQPRMAAAFRALGEPILVFLGPSLD
jgi:predicted Zn-dependent peptidase